MESLFTQVSESYQPAHKEKLVFHNPKTEQISFILSDLKSAWNKIGLSKTSVLVYLADLKAEARGNTGQFRLDDFVNDKQIDLIVDYQLQLNELHLIDAFNTFLRAPILEPVINDYIKTIIKDFSRTNPLIDAPETYLLKLQEHVQDRLQEYEPGFICFCRIKVMDVIPDKEQLSGEALRVRFIGGKGEIRLHFSAEVAVDGYRRDTARQSRLKDKEQLQLYLQDRIKTFFLEKVEQNQFFDRRYRRTVLTEDLEDYLNQQLRGHGRKLVFFEFNEAMLKEHSAPSGIAALPVQVQCQVRQASKFIPLDVSTKVTIELDDEGKAIMAGINSKDSLEEWASRNINEIVETTFLGQPDFADVVIAFFDGNNTIEVAIGEELENRASRIGYKLKYYNVLPDLKEYEDKRVEVEGQASNFLTKGGDIPMSLGFEVDGMIKSWETIKEYLRPDKDLKKSISERVMTTIKEVLLENYAERLYMHFYDPSDGQPSVEQELFDKITITLKEFDLDELKIRLIPAESDIRIRFAQVRDKIKRVSVVFKSLRKDSLPENIHYHFSYRITGIDDQGFNIFYSSKDIEAQYWMGQISESLKTTLITFLNTLEPQLVKYEHEEIRRFLQENFREKYAVPEIRRAFGMNVDIHEFRRDLTEQELEESKTSSYYIKGQGESDRVQIDREFAGLLDGGGKEKKDIDRRLNELYAYSGFETAEQAAEIKRLEERLTQLNEKKESTIDRFRSKYQREGLEGKVDPLALLAARKQQLLGDGESKEGKNKEERTDENTKS